MKRKASFVLSTVVLFNFAEAWPSISFVAAGAPYALVYEICDLKSLQDSVYEAGEWGSGFFPAVRLNGTLYFEKKITWPRVFDDLSSQQCMHISHNPSNFIPGISNIQAELCDETQECQFYATSPEAFVKIQQEPFEITFLERETDLKSSPLDVDTDGIENGYCTLEHTRQLWPSPTTEANRYLRGSTLCDSALSYPRFPKYICLEMGNVTELDSPDTLLVYSFSQSDGWREDNMFFWLAQGLEFNSRYHFVVLVSGKLDDSWQQLLNRIAAYSISFEWHRMERDQSDSCAWRSALTGEITLRHRLRRFSRYILLGAACRGPFIPPYYDSSWPEAFFTLLDENRINLVGSAASCTCEPPALQSEFSRPCAQLDGCLFAFSAEMLPKVLLELVDTPCNLPDESPAEDGALDGSGAGGSEALWRGLRVLGRQLTGAAISKGGGAAAMEHRWTGVDLGDAEAVARVCSAAADEGAREPNHPLDVVFVDESGRYGTQDTLYQFTRMALGNVPWSVPIHVFCGLQMATFDVRGAVA